MRNCAGTNTAMNGNMGSRGAFESKRGQNPRAMILSTTVYTLFSENAV